LKFLNEKKDNRAVSPDCFDFIGGGRV